MDSKSFLLWKATFLSAVVLSLLDGNFCVDPSLPAGHLKPLGANSPKHSLEVVDGFLSPQDFFQRYASTMKPLLFRAGAKLSAAFSKWSDEYFLSYDESDKLQIVAEKHKKENRTFPSQDMSFREFVETYRQEDIYMVDSVPPFLKKDVLLPPPLLCEDVELVDTVMWFSSGGTKSVLHNDDVDNINCLFSGVKELLFIEYKKYKDKVPIDFRIGGYSGVDVDRVDMIKYPGLRDVEYYNVTMQPGDCLFIPYKWFHQVRSYDRNIAVNVWWTHKADFVPRQCDMAPGQTLDNFKFPAQEGGGAGGEGRDRDILEHFKALLSGEDKLDYPSFEKRLREEPSFPGMAGQEFEWTEEFKEAVTSIFVVLDENKDGYLSAVDFGNIRNNDGGKINIALENEVAKIEDLIEDQLEPNIASNDKEPREEL